MGGVKQFVFSGSKISHYILTLAKKSFRKFTYVMCYDVSKKKKIKKVGKKICNIYILDLPFRVVNSTHIFKWIDIMKNSDLFIYKKLGMMMNHF